MTNKSPSQLTALPGSLSGTEPVMVSVLSTSVTMTAATLSALASDNSYNDSANQFLAEGFAAGDRVMVSGFTGNVANNVFSALITALTAGKMTIGGTDGNVIVDDAAGESVTITKWESYRTTAQAIATLAPASVTSWKQAVRAATTAAGTLATSFENGDAIDGVTLATGDRILVKNQAAGAENGIYTVNASGAPTRANDADTGAEMVNATVFVSEGTSNADTQWTCTTNAAITLGSTSLVFAQIGATPTIYRPVAFFFTTTPTASEVLMLYTAAEAITFPDDFANSVGDVGTNPTSSFAMSVLVNGSSVGSITISTGGAFTFVTTAGALSLSAGDQLKIVGPGSADATCANVSVTLKGTV